MVENINTMRDISVADFLKFTTYEIRNQKRREQIETELYFWLCKHV